MSTRRFKFPALELADFLFDDSHDVVQDALQRAQDLARSRPAEDASQQTWRPLCERFVQSKGFLWKDALEPGIFEHNAWYESLPRPLKISCVVHGHLLEAERQHREQQAAKAASASSGSSKPARKPNVLTAIDISQRIDRVRYSYNGLVKTITPDMKLWVLRSSRLQDDGTRSSQIDVMRPLLGIEALRLQGFPVEWIFAHEDITDATCADLGGNAFSFSIVAALYISILIAVRPAGTKVLKREGSDKEGIAALVRLMDPASL